MERKDCDHIMTIKVSKLSCDQGTRSRENRVCASRRSAIKEFLLQVALDHFVSGHLAALDSLQLYGFSSIFFGLPPTFKFYSGHRSSQTILFSCAAKLCIIYIGYLAYSYLVYIVGPVLGVSSPGPHMAPGSCGPPPAFIHAMHWDSGPRGHHSGAKPNAQKDNIGALGKHLCGGCAGKRDPPHQRLN